jgi:hypothetical protein
LEEGKVLSEEEKLRKATMINDLDRITLLEKVTWRKKSRTLWLRKGDKCTKLFHRVAYLNMRNNFIEEVVVNGTVSSDWSEIKEQILQFYNSLFRNVLVGS